MTTFYNKMSCNTLFDHKALILKFFLKKEFAIKNRKSLLFSNIQPIIMTITIKKQ